ncbi:MAG: hypothetical protein O7I93_14835 [Gemmatimonadetes bacterium]|nr:hypothetical protein [Gemmatimonadota bacterium]
MVRTIVGYAVIGVVGIIVINLAFGIVGLVFSLVWTLLTLAAIVFVFYLILRIVNPDAARRMREKVAGKPKEES